MNDIYSKTFLDHFVNPRNIGQLRNADGYAKIGDPSCGDFIEVWLLIKNDIITDFKYKVFGCGGAIATTSVVSELAMGKHIKEAVRLTDANVIEALGGIPENKAHCSLLGIKALRAAVADYLIKENHKKYQQRIQEYKRAGYDIPEHRKALVKQLRNLPPQANVLDIGTGKGHLALAIARQGWHCVSVDISSKELYFARLNAIYFQLDDKIELKQQDARQLEFLENSFDAVLCADMVHHLAQPSAVFSEMVRVCQQNGLIAISDLNEKGKKIIEHLLQQEGKYHPTLGWEFEEIKKWFELKGAEAQIIEYACENFLIARFNHQKLK